MLSLHDIQWVYKRWQVTYNCSKLTISHLIHHTDYYVLSKYEQQVRSTDFQTYWMVVYLWRIALPDPVLLYANQGVRWALTSNGGDDAMQMAVTGQLSLELTTGET